MVLKPKVANMLNLLNITGACLLMRPAPLLCAVIYMRGVFILMFKACTVWLNLVVYPCLCW